MRAAYSSGKPALGMGQGNVQTIVDRDVDLGAAAEKIIIGRSFDNGLICLGEQCAFIPEEKFDAFVEEFKKHEGYYCFHAGTKFNGDQIVTNGGRVLGVTAKGKDLKEARANAYAATEWVNFKNKYMRHDIGKAIDEA